MNVLYISYDGAADTLGQSQIVPYLLGLLQKNVSYTLLTFEKERTLHDQDLLNSVIGGLNNKIDWIFLKYHKRPYLMGTLYDIIRGFFTGLRVVRAKKIKIIHGRSFVGSVIAFLLQKAVKIKTILDLRGFWPEERVEAGLWKKDGWLFKIAKFTERALILNADEIVILTAEGKKEIEKSGYLQNKKINISVIPTCVDITNNAAGGIDNGIFNNMRIDNKFVISYIGSVSTWYMPVEMFRFFDIAQKAIGNSFFLILTQERKLLEGILARTGGRRGNISILDIEHRFVPQYLSLAKIGLAFYKPGYSRKACCPVKFGEYLAQGLPVIINRGIGDCDEIIFKEKVGVVINEFSIEEYDRALRELLELLLEEDILRKRCRAVAKKYFSLDLGIDRYSQVYQRLGYLRS